MPMSIILHESQVQEQLNFLIDTLQRGGLIVYPTETLYGIGCDAFNRDANMKICALKKRDFSRPMLVLIDSIASSLALAADHHDVIEQLGTFFWPGALTIIVGASSTVPEWLSSNEKKIAFRVSSNPSALMITHSLMKPLISTSANSTGDSPCSSIEQAVHLFQEKIDIYVDGGTLEGTSSTIIDINSLPAHIVREGRLPVAQIREKFPYLF